MRWNTIDFLKNTNNEKSITIDNLIEKIKVIEEKLDNTVPIVPEPTASVDEKVES